MNKIIISSYESYSVDEFGVVKELSRNFPYCRIIFVADADCTVATPDGLKTLKTGEVLVAVDGPKEFIKEYIILSNGNNLNDYIKTYQQEVSKLNNTDNCTDSPCNETI